MKTPIEMMLDGIEWKPCRGEVDHSSDLPYVTHEGVLRIGLNELRCYTLNTGERVFDADDIKELFTDGRPEAGPFQNGTSEP